MVDYYSILLRAVTAPGAGDAHWRRSIYDRSRQMLATRMRSLEPPAPLADIADEEARLEAAIERIESELSWTEEHATQKARVTQKPRPSGRMPSLQESLKPESLKPESLKPDSLRPSSVRPGSKPDSKPGSRRPLSTPSFKPTSKPANRTAATPADEEFAETSDDYFTADSEPGWSPRGLVLIALAVVVAAVGAGGYLFLSGKGQKPAPAQQAQKAAAPNVAVAKATAPSETPSRTAPASAAPKLAAVNTGKNGELAPGVDGGPSDPDLQYVFRRQPTFYRTLQPVGTVIVDKGQHFLYLIQPNNVALRYGIAVGDQCSNLAGMRHISTMAEWPPWQPPPEMLRSNPAPLPGGPGNPLGARILQLDDGNSRINGTNAPKTIGNPVNFGCIRLNNDDVTDLYGRVKLSTPVVVN
jgi:lipoprotein-anchoring transpeptidase ErfK/SrfK